MSERKPEEELFLLVDDDLDNDIISSHAAAFHRVDPQINHAQTAATSQSSAPSKTSAAEGDVAKKMTEKDVVDVSRNAINQAVATTAAKTTSEEATAKRLVLGDDWVVHQHSQDCTCVNRYHFTAAAGRSGVPIPVPNHKMFVSARFLCIVVVISHPSSVSMEFSIHTSSHFCGVGHNTQLTLSHTILVIVTTCDTQLS